MRYAHPKAGGPKYYRAASAGLTPETDLTRIIEYASTYYRS